MKISLPKITSFLVLLALFLGFLMPLSAEETTLEKGIIQYQRENYDEALDFLNQAQLEDPADTRVSYYLGLTYKKLQDYKLSQRHLTAAVEGEPKIKEALLELIEVSYQLDDVESAKKWIAVAEEMGMRPGQTKFIKGLVLVKDGNTEEAVKAFREAKDLEPNLKQSANYQIGMAQMKDKSYDEAAKSFQEVVLLDPNTDIARFADEYKKALDRRREASRVLRANAGFFVEYDDNVILKPNDDTAVGEVGNQSDVREVATVDVELGKKFSDVFGAKLQYNLYYTHQNDLHAFDLNSHTVGAAPSFYAGPHVLSVPVQYNYIWVDDKDYLETISVNPLANLKIADNQLGQVGVKFQDKEYDATPSNANEDRNGTRWAPGAAWFFFFHENKAFLNLRYEYDFENTRGGNWDYSGHRANAAVQYPLAEKLKLTLVGEGYWQEFDNAHSAFNVTREDENYTASASLSYAIDKQWDGQLRYTHIEHPSNITIYEYTRNIVSAGVTARF